jgi:hypothetical protein
MAFFVVMPWHDHYKPDLLIVGTRHGVANHFLAGVIKNNIKM